MRILFKVFLLVMLSTTMYMHAEYKSQCGQDRYFNENFFHNKKGGVFLDIGAHNGVTISNTWFFENVLGWEGICFEPMPDIFNQLVSNRKCTCINGAVSDVEGYRQFRRIHGHVEYCEMLSGLQSKYDPRHIQRIEAWCNNLQDSYSETIDVYCYLLNDILEKYHYDYIDFLSLDTEGGELDILKTIDFSRFYIYAITVENNYRIKDIREFMEAKGFRFVRNLEQDEVYINTAPYEKKN